MLRPKDKEGVRRFQKLVQNLSKFISNLSQVEVTLRVMRERKQNSYGIMNKKNSFSELKRLCSKQPVHAFSGVNKPVKIHCDASKTGLGVALVQTGCQIAYPSLSLDDAYTKRCRQLSEFYGHCNDLICPYNLSLGHMLSHMFHAKH
jgi:hypothetical protein